MSTEEAKPVDTTTTTTASKTKIDDTRDLPDAKKQKTTTTTATEDSESKAPEMTATETKKATTPESPDSEWPEAWYMMEDGTYEDQKERNRLSPNKPASVELLRELGIAYWKMDAETYSYPAKAIPWDPKDAADPKLMAIRDDREYIVSCVCCCASSEIQSIIWPNPFSCILSFVPRLFLQPCYLFGIAIYSL
jgi:hypothetical protein